MTSVVKAFTAVLDFIIRYAGLASLIAWGYQAYNSRPRLSIHMRQFEWNTKTGIRVSAYGDVELIDDPSKFNLIFRFCLANHSHLPCCIESWSLRVGDMSVSNYETWKTDQAMHYGGSGAYPILPEVDPYLRPFQVVHASLAFEVPASLLKRALSAHLPLRKPIELQIAYSAYNWRSNTLYHAKHPFRPPKPLYEALTDEVFERATE